MKFLQYMILLSIMAIVFSCGGAPSDADFLEIVKTGSTEEISDAAKKGADLDARTKRDKMTPLMVAARYNNSESVKVLIEAGADVNAIDSVENTALRYAISYNDTTAVKHIVDADADVNDIGKLGITPLIIVSMRGTPQMGEVLVEAGADPYIADTNPVEQFRREPMYFAEFNDKIPTADRIELFARPLNQPVAELVADIDEVAQKRPTEGSVLEGNVVLLRRQQPMTGTTTTRLVVQEIEERSWGYVGMMTVGSSALELRIQVYPIPASVGEQLKSGDRVNISGMFFWGRYEDIEDDELRRASDMSSTKYSFVLRERFIGRAGNAPLLYITKIEEIN
jgi:hypothetical protein